MKKTILCIDDEDNIRNGLQNNFELEGYNALVAKDGKEGLHLVDTVPIDVVITDMRMDGITGIDIVRTIAEKHPALPVIVLTGHGSIDTAVEAMKLGAFDFLTKPLKLDTLNAIVKRALKNHASPTPTQAAPSVADIPPTKAADQQDTAFSAIIGKSSSLRHIFEIVQKAAPTNATVLITGESGTGKELIANAIHDASPRKDGAFIKVHCAALSATLLESELFGHEKGAYTGAASLQKGRFERADGGTIFLDEIGEIDQSTQVKLLRVLQEREFERVGGTQTIKVDTRIVAATNRNLLSEVQKGTFREDLYYRLNVINIKMPSLRERRDDIPLLIDFFLKKFNQENGRQVKISRDALDILSKYDWPGNIRQLQNAVESSCVLCSNDTVQKQDLPSEIAP